MNRIIGPGSCETVEGEWCVQLCIRDIEDGRELHASYGCPIDQTVTIVDVTIRMEATGTVAIDFVFADDDECS